MRRSLGRATDVGMVSGVVPEQVAEPGGPGRQVGVAREARERTTDPRARRDDVEPGVVADIAAAEVRDVDPGRRLRIGHVAGVGVEHSGTGQRAARLVLEPPRPVAEAARGRSVRGVVGGLVQPLGRPAGRPDRDHRRVAREVDALLAFVAGGRHDDHPVGDRPVDGVLLDVLQLVAAEAHVDHHRPVARDREIGRVVDAGRDGLARSSTWNGRRGCRPTQGSRRRGARRAPG
jgi:hypothetical protein